ncbi:peptidase S8/S53 domain-containing protein [Mycena galericulata]|nr:peptidase S8/S53 domain-containing protein [Mycena galericulata]
MAGAHDPYGAALQRSLFERTGPVASCNSSRPDGIVTPTCLQQIYGIPSTPATQKNNKILVTGYFGASPNRTDLTKFLEQFRPDIPLNTTFDVITIDNATNQGLATGVPVQFLSVGGSSLSDFVTPILDMNTFLDGVDNPPSVMTTSYGVMENQFESAVPKKICDSYMALSARGISVQFASGDRGVRSTQDNSSIPGACESNVFIPEFPASCPYVTAVGATQGFKPEVATNLTGGGFSDLFSRPWYQTKAVDSFLKAIPLDFAGTFNKSGRGYPDVAAQGWDLDMVFEGFLNPWIYANSKAFTDITEGHNSGLSCPASSVAFDATKGWDALSRACRMLLHMKKGGKHSISEQ